MKSFNTSNCCYMTWVHIMCTLQKIPKTIFTVLMPLFKLKEKYDEGISDCPLSGLSYIEL